MSPSQLYSQMPTSQEKGMGSLKKRLLFLLPILVLGATSCTRAQDTLSTAVESVWCGDARVYFQTKCAGELSGVQFLHVHENERTAVIAVTNMLERFGRGCFVTWMSQGERYVKFTIDTGQYRIDPNRIYTAAGRKMTLTDGGLYTPAADSAVANLASVFLKNYIDSSKLLVAFHNNTDDGGLTIHGYEKGGPYARDASETYANPATDEDDFFLTTDKSIFNFIKAKGFNVLLQDNAHVTDDGSLSVYAAMKHIPYLNLETQHGHLKEQLEMIDVIQALLAERYGKKKGAEAPQ